MRIGVTGASGYVGDKQIRYLRQTDHEVVELGRRRVHCPPSRFVRFSLEGGINPSRLEDVDSVVNFAYDLSAVTAEEIERTNVDGTVALFDAAAASDCHVVQVSSLSAFDGCRSGYGQAKRRLEHKAMSRDYSVVRPGLVYGAELGGLVQLLADLTEQLPAVPVPTGCPHRHYTCHYDDLVRLLTDCCIEEYGTSRHLVAASRNPIGFEELLNTLAAYRETTIRTLPVPLAVALYPVRLLERLGVDIPIRGDSILGLVDVNEDPDFAETDRVGGDFRELDHESLSAELTPP